MPQQVWQLGANLGLAESVLSRAFAVIATSESNGKAITACNFSNEALKSKHNPLRENP